jgi:hypothetical protein
VLCLLSLRQDSVEVPHTSRSNYSR